MAKCNVNFPTEICGSLASLEAKTDAVIFEALQAGGNVALDAIKAKLSDVVGKNIKHESRSTGELKASLGLTQPRISYNGVCNIKVGFSEPRRNQISSNGKRKYREQTNAMIATVLEYGRSGQSHKPFLKPALKACKDKVVAAMGEVFDKELK